jgi:hypothetical protein
MADRMFNRNRSRQQRQRAGSLAIASQTRSNRRKRERRKLLEPQEKHFECRRRIPQNSLLMHPIAIPVQINRNLNLGMMVSQGNLILPLSLKR